MRTVVCKNREARIAIATIMLALVVGSAYAGVSPYDVVPTFDDRMSGRRLKDHAPIETAKIKCVAVLPFYGYQCLFNPPESKPEPDRDHRRSRDHRQATSPCENVTDHRKENARDHRIAARGEGCPGAASGDARFDARSSGQAGQGGGTGDSRFNPRQ